MEYRAVRNRVAISLEDMYLPVSDQQVLQILKHQGFILVEMDIIKIARSCIGLSNYHRGARCFEAPNVVDCSSFVKYVYGQCGIWLPRRSIQQRALGEIVELDHVLAGDVIFTSGHIDYYINDPADGVGHVGIATGMGTVVHAASKKYGVVESSLEKFVSCGRFRGARRYLTKNILFFETPTEREIEIADDIKWIVMQSL